MLKIDLENDREIAILLAWIIYDKHHPLREQIIESYESSIKIIIDLHINKKTYEDIVREELEGINVKYHISSKVIDEEIARKKVQVDECKIVLKKRLLRVLRKSAE